MTLNVSQAPKKKRGFFDYFGTTANLVGTGGAIVGGVVAGVLTANPIVAVVAAGAMYGAGFLFAHKDAIHLSLEPNSNASRDEVAKSIALLTDQIRANASSLTSDIQTVSLQILATVTDMLPHWEQMSAIAGTKAILSSLVTEYLPEALNTYISLPKSYLSRNKAKAEKNTLDQLNLLKTQMDKVQDAVFSGVEDKIITQTNFLKDKFGVNSENSSLNLESH